MTQIDYRENRWGHSIYLDRPSIGQVDGAPQFSGCLFSSARVNVGTELVLSMKSGRPAVFLVDEIRSCNDPEDMYFFKAHPVRYLEDQ